MTRVTGWMWVTPDGMTVIEQEGYVRLVEVETGKVMWNKEFRDLTAEQFSVYRAAREFWGE